MEPKKLTKRELFQVAYNMTLTIMLLGLLLAYLHCSKEHFPSIPKPVLQELALLKDSLANAKFQSLKPQGKTLSATDSLKIMKDSLNMVNEKKARLSTEKEASGFSFFDILCLMLLGGSLGGVLCNLRGLFVYFRDKKTFPDELFIPYLVRPFSSAVCGLFIFFVLNLLVTSVTIEVKAENIPFQSMVSYMSLAILAGFGGQEFMERLKATAKTLFGEKERKNQTEQLEEWYKLFKTGVISETEYNKKKDELLKEGKNDTDIDRGLRQND